MSILICQNSVYISKKWWYLSNQEQFRIDKQIERKPEYLVGTSGVQESGWADNTSRFQKTIEYCGRERKYWKRELNNISG